MATQPTRIPTHTYISGNISYCSNPSPGPVPNVTLTLTGDTTTSATTDSPGGYQFSSLVLGGSFVVTPSKALPPGSDGIDSVDVIAVKQHLLNIALLSGCRPTAADVNRDDAINTVDVIAIHRFFLGLSIGIANVGSISSILRAARIRGLLLIRPARITKR